MTTHIMTEEEKIAKYDAERSGAVYAKPGADLPADLKAWIDYHLEREEQGLPYVKDSFTRGLIDGARIADALNAGNEDEATALIDDILNEENDDPHTISVEPWFQDVDRPGDFTEEPGGALAWTDFELGAGKSKIILTVNAGEGLLGPDLILGGCDVNVTLDEAEQVALNILAILADERMIALRGKPAATAYMQGKAAGLDSLLGILEAEQAKRRSTATPVTVERHRNTDTVDLVNFGKEEGTEFTCGETQIYFADDGHEATVDAFGTYFESDMLDRDLANLQTLLNDPRVIAARAAKG